MNERAKVFSAFIEAADIIGAKFRLKREQSVVVNEERSLLDSAMILFTFTATLSSKQT